jgi:membrane dipeptidase
MRLVSLVTALALLATPSAFAQDAKLEAKAHRIHDAVITLDSHLDIPLDYGTGAHDPAIDGDTQVDLPKLERGGLDAAVLAVFVSNGPRTPDKIAAAAIEAETKLNAIRAITTHYPDRAALALHPADVVRIHHQHKVAIVIGFLNAYPLGNDISAIDAYYARGVRTFGFVHAGNNDFADSSRGGPEEHAGLSPLGKEAVGKLNRLGVIIDVSQLTKKGLLQTTALSTAPVVATHSGVRALVESPRNLTDEELDAVAATGGVIQIVAFKSYIKAPPAGYTDGVRAVRAKYALPAAFQRANDDVATLPTDKRDAYSKEVAALFPDATVSDLVDSIDYAVKRIGIDHVGISSDFNHGGGIDGFRNEGEAFNITRELVKRGYTKRQIAKLWGGNFLRVWRAVERQSHSLARHTA